MMRARSVVATIVCLLALAAPSAASAKKAAAGPMAKDPNAEARGIIADLQRVVTPNGVQESFEAPIGGLKQWVSVRGKDRDHPLLLFVHGGPASPSMPLAWMFQRPWEDYFTVVNWDQRGAGKTYVANPPEAVGPTLHIDRYVDDTIELIEFLRKRYGKRKVVLVGHSWGTIVALKAALRRPDLIHAYVGMGQVISVADNERLGYEFALKKAHEEGNAEAIRELDALAPYPGSKPLTRERIIAERKWAQHYSGLSAYRTDSAFYFDAPKLSPEYDAADRAAIDLGNQLTLSRILAEWNQVDFKSVRDVPFPVFMFMGRHDESTPSEQADRWLAGVKAPVKRAVWFEYSSHLAPIEEPGRTLVSLVQDVLPLATEGEP